jgi:hypothetical protein
VGHQPEKLLQGLGWNMDGIDTDRCLFLHCYTGPDFDKRSDVDLAGDLAWASAILSQAFTLEDEPELDQMPSLEADDGSSLEDEDEDKENWPPAPIGNEFTIYVDDQENVYEKNSHEETGGDYETLLEKMRELTLDERDVIMVNGASIWESHG